MAPLTRSARKPPSAFPEQTWSSSQVPRASRFQQTQDAHLDEEDEDTGDHYDDHDLEMEDELEEEEDEEVMESADEEDGAEASEDSPDATSSAPRIMSSRDVKEVVMPLQNLADRVWKQVEDFAKNLDKFNPSEKVGQDIQNWKDACTLVEKYRSIARDNLKRAEKDQKLGKSTSRPRSRATHRASGNITDDQTAGDERERCQNEVDTWDLLWSLLAVDDPDTRESASHARDHTLQSLHRYSTDYDIWESFLASDIYARESVAVLKWLQSTADASRESIDEFIADLETEAERGDGLWASGWLYTKEEIKKSKRLRAWPQPIDPNTPGIDETFKNAADEPVVTHLDPDALSRQGRSLHREDHAHEKAMWLASWELLRRGKSWDEIRQWFQDRGEGWRALSLRGSKIDSRSDAAIDAAHHGLSRMMNLQALSVWRESCYEISKGHPYTQGVEEAVYGLLSGHSLAASKACTRLDDHLFARYNSIVLKHHDEYSKAYRGLLETGLAANAAYSPPPPAYDSIRNFLNHARRDPKFKQDCMNPCKIIQGAILTKDYPILFARQGQALNQIANESRASKLFPRARTDLVDVFAKNAAEDSDALRITAHLFLITKALGYEDPADPNFGIMEDNLVGYISFLKQAGKLALIPLYASRLSEARRHRVLGQMLVDITNESERNLQIKLMKQYKINIASVVRSQLESNLQDAIAIQSTSTYTFRPKRFLEPAPEGWGFNARVQANFMEEEVLPEDELLIRSMEWHRHLTSHWLQVCHYAALLYKRFIALGRFGAVRALHTRAPLSELSIAITGVDLSEFAISSEEVSEDEGEDRPRSRRTRSGQSQKSSRSHSGQQSVEDPASIDREQLYEQAKTWRELEQLANIFELFSEWSLEAQEVQRLRKQGGISEPTYKIRPQFQKCFHKICVAVDPLLSDWLIHPKDDEEAKVLEDIRVTYLPEVVLGFNGVLIFAGHALSREHLPQSMNLATQVATNPNLTQVFVEAKRMRELTTAFALSAKAMLYANQSAGQKKFKRTKFPEGENMEIWQVKPQDVGLA